MLDQAGDGVSPFSLSSGCLNASEAAIKCHGRSKDYKCCSNEDYCNKQLLSDRRDPTTPLSDECNSVSGGFFFCAERRGLILKNITNTVVCVFYYNVMYC